MASIKYSVDVERRARCYYNTRLSSIYYLLEENKFSITKEILMERYNSKVKELCRRERLNRVPIIGKMFGKKEDNSFYHSCESYLFLLSVMENLGVDEITFDILEKVLKANKDNFYEKHYKCLLEQKFASESTDVAECI